jgi:hypothetical protein
MIANSIIYPFVLRLSKGEHLIATQSPSSDEIKQKRMNQAGSITHLFFSRIKNRRSDNSPSSYFFLGSSLPT